MSKKIQRLMIAIALMGQGIIMSGVRAQDFDPGVQVCLDQCLECGRDKRCFENHKAIEPRPNHCDPKCNDIYDKCYEMCKDGY